MKVSRHHLLRRSALRSRIGVERLEQRLLLSVTSPDLPSTPALYNPATGTFLLRNENSGGVADTAFAYGPAGQGWVPITGDWNSDGVDTVGVFNPTTSTFYLKNENASGAADLVIPFGPAGSGWTPVVGDWDGNGTVTIGLYNPATGVWFLRNALAGGLADQVFGYGAGGAGWRPIVGDWNNDGVDTVGVYDPASGTFFTRNDNSPGVATTVVQYGAGGLGWAPLAGDWDGDGIDTFAVQNPAAGSFNLRNVALPGPADLSFGYGPAGVNWVPLSGRWIFDPFDTAGGLYATPGGPNDDVPTKFTLLAELADFNNEIGLYVVDDSSGRVGALQPGDPGYAAAALSSPSRRVIFPQGAEPGAMTTLELPGDRLFALYLIQDNTTAAFLTFNPTNNPALIPQAFFSLTAANPDDFDHVKNLAPIVFAWEDQTGGGDEDFNDSIVLFQFGTPVANIPPVAANDSYATDEDTTLAVDAVMGLLANDTDGDGDPLTAVLETGPANGTLTLDSDGSFTYTPDADFNGTDSFTYRADDGTSVSAAATVTITVNPVNDAPIAVDDVFATDEDITLIVAAPGVLGNDTDVDGDTLTAVVDTFPANGTLVLNPDGSFSYTPDADFNGTDTFTYTANDGTVDSNIATVTITVNPVNDAPIAVDDAFTTDEDTVLTVAAPGVLGNDTDVEGDTLTAVLDAGPTNGTLVLNPDGSFSYTPNADFNGADSFTYHANDGTDDSNIATVSIAVIAVNDAPVAVDDAVATDEDTPLIVPAPGVLGNDTDVDGDILTAVLDAGPANGTLVLNPDGSFIYTPNAEFNGTDTFTYTANDGTVDSNIATVTITVTAVNDAPVAVDDTVTTDEDTPVTVAAPGVLANDTDVEGDALTAVLDAGPTNGTLVLNPDGSYTYTPNADFNGTDTFTYHANDGAADSNIATVTITVNPVNDAPVAVDDTVATDEDTPLIVGPPGVLGNDTDVDGDTLTAALVTGVANGTLVLNSDGSYVYTPNADFNGTDSFTYVANDGTADSNTATVTITVNPVNDPPLGVDDTYFIAVDTTLTTTAGVDGVLDNDSDPEGDTLTATLMTGVSNGTLTLNTDGSFTYTPNSGFLGTDTFSYVASDGTDTSAEVFVTIFVGLT